MTGYGLAAVQLKRFKESGLKLAIFVEQLAASGGYMMCCVADNIAASPFISFGEHWCYWGSYNFYERLRKEGM